MYTSKEFEKKYWWLAYKLPNECTLCRTQLNTVTTTLDNHSTSKRHKINLDKYKNSSIQSSQMTQINSQNSECTEHSNANFRQLETGDHVHISAKQTVSILQKPDQNPSLKRSWDPDQNLNAEKKARIERPSATKYIYDVYSSSEIMEIPIKLEFLGEEFLNVLNKEMGLKFCQMLSEDVVAKPFSLFLEIIESQDDINRMGIIIRYYSDTFKKFISLFLDNVKLDVGYVQSRPTQITNAIEKTAKKFKLQLEYLIGIGVHISSEKLRLHIEQVFRHLKNKYEIVSFYPILCISGSLQKASAKALSNSFYAGQENWIKNTYIWFDRFKNEFENLYVILNVKEILKYYREFDDVSWFFIPSAVNNIWTKWEDLKALFEKTKTEQAKNLYKIYNKKSVKDILFCLKEHLKDVKLANEKFESLDPDAVKMLLTFSNLRDDISSSDKSCKKHVQKSNISEREKDTILIRHAEFKKKFIDSINCLDVNSKNSNDVFESYRRMQNNLENLSIQNSDAKNIVALVESKDEIRKEKIILEWNKLQLNLSKLSDTSKLQKSWEEIFDQKDSSGDVLYPEISLLAMKHLSLPLSDFNVKCIFRQINCMKVTDDTKLTTLNDILRIQYYLKYINECTEKDSEVFFEIIKNFTPADLK